MSEENTLIGLAAREAALIEQLHAVTNEPDQAVFKAVHAQVSQLYKLVYHEYVELLQTTADAAVHQEALKRTVFLRWYAVTEPDWYTGIGHIEPHDTARVFDALEAAISRNQLDEEFDWMLAYYALGVWDFALQPLAGEIGPWPIMAAFLREKTAFSERTDSDYSPLPAYVNPSTMAGRGQLSTYWLSIINR